MKEPTLGNPQNTIAVLQKYNFIFQKKFGQNFLIDTHVLDKIIRAAEIGKDDLVQRINDVDQQVCQQNDDPVFVMCGRKSNRSRDRQSFDPDFGRYA